MSPLNLSLDIRVKESQRDSKQEDSKHEKISIGSFGDGRSHRARNVSGL